MQRVTNIVRQLAEELRKDDCDGKSEAAAAACRPVNCLLVEDEDSDALLTLEAIGSVGGVTATRAHTGDEALRLLAEYGKSNPFDIVFVDLMLRGSSAQGAEVVQAIRKQFPRTHTVIISGHLGQNVLDSMQGGYVGVIQKPLQADNLSEILDKHRMRSS